ncbi:uncharacterized protein LOC110158693 isoform X1 [Boleophthalmus pectinirostris]|uniref:uncharacterized protein LOC110158693 isoform X1 n=2 Tax=Boleophthalmus pectinirostris TaxID=150288 RepID=UPI00242CA331|nr:uncharacterized protein LOC110158693 isoform X1 [Boleophthalmus pectinirostris]
MTSHMLSMEPPLVTLPQFTENSYKMTEDDVKRLIEFRASNEALFTGKRNSAKIAWSVILKGLGLEGKLTPDQIAKKWDNLRTKYKDLKQPYQGQEVSGVVESWPWFHMMEEAMHGRLYNSSMVLNPDSEPDQNQEQNQTQNQTQENQDILEFLIKTEMDESVNMSRRTRSSTGNTTTGAALGWRRISECSYKWTDNETEKLIKLRAANEVLFTGRRNTAKPAWRAILFEMGLQGKVSIDQLAKKWDNLKRKYKELKFPAPGVDPNLSSWPWFFRMNEAMEGRLAGAAPLLTPIIEDEDEFCEAPSPMPKKRPRRSRGMTDFLTESEIDLLVENVEKNGAGNLAETHRGSEYSYKLTEEDTRRLIELRAANEVLFTGKRNTVKPAWRGIVKELGLTGKITPDQVAKKWDNLKTRFKDLKFPPQGMEGQVNPAGWPWFQLMSDAFEGRLLGKAPAVEPVWNNADDTLFLSSPPPSVPPERDCPLEDRSAVQELEQSLVSENSIENSIENTEHEESLGHSEGNVTLIDANGEESSPTEHSYKMSEEDTQKMIKLRAANEALFTGRRNAAKAAWRAILRELGLQGKVSTVQLAKKWDNLKRRYKDLRFPPVGMETSVDPSSWPWFSLMHDAIEGRLSHSAPLLDPENCGEEPDDPPNKLRPQRQIAPPIPHQAPPTPHQPPPTPHQPPPPPPPPPSHQPANQIHIPPNTATPTPTAPAPDFSTETFVTENNVALHREWGILDRERALLERDRQLVEQEKASVQRERAAVQAERMWLERERADLQRDRAMVDQERAALARDREILDQRAIMLNTVGHVQHLNSLM